MILWVFCFVFLVLVLRKSERRRSRQSQVGAGWGRGRRLGAQSTLLLRKGTLSCTPHLLAITKEGRGEGSRVGSSFLLVAVVPSAGPITGVSSSWTRHIGLWPRCGRPRRDLGRRKRQAVVGVPWAGRGPVCCGDPLSPPHS